MSHNVGMLFMRREYRTSGRMCSDCLGRAYLDHQWRNMVFGWWGLISFFLTWYFLLANTATFVSARWRLIGEGRQGAAEAPGDDAATERRLAAFAETVARRLADGDDADDIAVDIAEVTGVSPKRARRFVQDQADSG